MRFRRFFSKERISFIPRKAVDLGSILYLKSYRPVPIRKCWRTPKEPFIALTWSSAFLLAFGIVAGFLCYLALDSLGQKSREVHLTSIEKAALERDLYRVQSIHRASTRNMLSVVEEVQKVLETCSGSQRAFLFRLIPLALEFQAQYEIPASALIAQAIYESGYGRSDLARKHHNFFGIKAWDSTWSGEVARMPTRDHGVATMADFRAYPDFETGVEGYARFLSESPRYREAFRHQGAVDFVRAILRAGYCPDKNYLSRIKDIIDRHELHRLDSGKLSSFLAEDGDLGRQAGTMN